MATERPQGTTRVTDPEALKALTHPLRLRLLGLLRIEGPATATELARRTSESSGSTSYHLRQLARFGFIDDDPDQPGGRERRWRAVHRWTAWKAADFLDEPSGLEASDALERHQLRRQVALHEAWLARRTTVDKRWLDAAGASDDVLRLTSSQTRQLQDDLLDLMRRYREAPPATGDPDEPTAYIATFTEVLPFEEVPI